MSEREGNGCWVVYYADWSGIAVFGTEIDALRYANDNDGMRAEYVGWGLIR